MITLPNLSRYYISSVTAAAEHKSNFKLNKYTPYLSLPGELYGVSSLGILEEIDHIVMASHWNSSGSNVELQGVFVEYIFSVIILRCTLYHSFSLTFWTSYGHSTV